MPMFVTSPNRQDYQFGGATIFSLGQTSQGAGIGLTTNNSLTISGSTVTIKTLEQYNGAVGDVCYITGTGSNYDSTYTANGSTTSWGGNTYTITVINGLTLTATLTGSASGTSGSAGINDFGWLEDGTMAQLNTNSPIPSILQLEAVRTLTPEWLVLNPRKVCILKDNGDGTLKIRTSPVPGSTTWAINLVYQARAPLKTALSDTWAPFPDEYGFVYRQAFLARAYRYINSPRSEAEYQKLQVAIARATGEDDREMSDQHLVPSSSLLDNTITNRWWF